MLTDDRLLKRRKIKGDFHSYIMDELMPCKAVQIEHKMLTND